jgi:hypothetical protein
MVPAVTPQEVRVWAEINDTLVSEEARVRDQCSRTTSARCPALDRAVHLMEIQVNGADIAWQGRLRVRPLREREVRVFHHTCPSIRST